MSLIGIRFDDKSLLNVIAQHSGDAGTAVPASRTEPPVMRSAPSAPAPPVEQPRAEPVNTTSHPVRVGIPEGAITVTVKEAMAATGLGRTTIDKLMGNGTLDRIKVGGRTLIAVESITRLIARDD